MQTKYPIGGYAPGNYHNRCSTCERSFFGDKQAVQCEECALADRAKFDALSPSEQEELVKRNVELFNELMKNSSTEQLSGADEAGRQVGWVNACERLPGLRMRVRWRSSDDEWVGLTEEFLMEMPITALREYEWYDESPSKESEAVEFAEWLAENTEIIREEKITLYRYCDKMNEWGNYTLEDIYQVFKLKSHEES